MNDFKDNGRRHAFSMADQFGGFMTPLLVQGVGFLGMLFAFISLQQNKNKMIVLYQTLAATTFAIHFLLLGAYVATALNMAGVARNVVFLNRDKKWADNTAWLYAFMVLFVISGVSTLQNAWGILPIVAMIFNTTALWMHRPKLTRIIMLPASLLWLVYNVAAGSIAGVLTESFVMLSLFIAFIRFDMIGKSQPPVTADLRVYEP